MDRNELVRAIRWKLGVPVSGRETFPAGEAQAAWEQFREHRAFDAIVARLGDLFGRAMADAVVRPLQADTLPRRDQLDAALWQAFLTWLREQPREREALLSLMIRKAIDQGRADMRASRSSTAPAAPKALLPMPEVPPTAQWRYQPPPDEPEPQEDSDARQKDTPEGWLLMGARVRGKMHKHQGTHCDDWFEMATSGPWTITAVSDGAGSKKFSRVGARLATQAASWLLQRDLQQHILQPREEWTVDTFHRDEQTGAFTQPDLQAVQQALHDAMHFAAQKIEEGVAGRSTIPDYAQVLRRPLETADLSCTLLLTVHAVVPFRDSQYSFLLACQVGDGMTAAVDQRGQLTVLGIADAGEYSGQTEFLTAGRLDAQYLARKTVAGFCRLRCLMSMTDGVADDYFPADPELKRLEADLVINGVLPVNGPEPLPVLPFAAAELDASVDVIGPQAGQTERLRQVRDLAARLEQPLPQVLSEAPLWLAAREGAALLEEQEVPQRLRRWLDTYQVRGSFDDRTLVVMHRGTL